MIISCWTCRQEFDRGETSQVTCDQCKEKEYTARAKDAIGKKVRVGWAYNPNYWSPRFGDGIAQEVLKDGSIKVEMEDGSIRTTRNFSIYIVEKPKHKQLTLF